MAWWDEHLEGRRIGIYRIEEKLGQGGMAEVFRAVIVDGRRKGHSVAIKVPLVGKFGADDLPLLFRRFEREVDLQNAEPIPNVVNLIDAGEITDRRGNQRPYLVMDFLSGGSLAAKLGGTPGNRLHKQTVSQVLRWLTPIAAALDALHASKPPRLHRDVKPENILFNSAAAPFLTDFGIATTLAEHSTGTMMTGAGSGSPGSPGYQPPEALRGEKLASSDQFSLAVTVYEALSRKLPFAGGSPTEMFVALARWNVIDLRERCPDLPESSVNAVMKGLSEKADVRFSSCSEFAIALAESAKAPPQAANSKAQNPEPDRKMPKESAHSRAQAKPGRLGDRKLPPMNVPISQNRSNKRLYLVLSLLLPAILGVAVLLIKQQPSQDTVASRSFDKTKVINSETERQIGQIATAAATALSESRLYEPVGDNALEYYLAIRDLDPSNVNATSFLVDLLPITVIAAEQSIDQRDFIEAKRLLGLIEKVDPQHPAAARLKDNLALSENNQEKSAVSSQSNEVTPEKPKPASPPDDTEQGTTEDNSRNSAQGTVRAEPPQEPSAIEDSTDSVFDVNSNPFPENVQLYCCNASGEHLCEARGSGSSVVVGNSCTCSKSRGGGRGTYCL